MRRRLFTFFSALSLLPLMATCSLGGWARAAAPREPLNWFRIAERQSYGVGTESSGVIAFLQRERPEYRGGDPADVLFRRWGARYYRVTSDGMRRWNLVVPYWAIAAAAAVLPAALAVRAMRARRRSLSGLCAECGYDLRATPDRCPECGTARVAA